MQRLAAGHSVEAHHTAGPEADSPAVEADIVPVGPKYQVFVSLNSLRSDT